MSLKGTTLDPKKLPTSVHRSLARRHPDPVTFAAAAQLYADEFNRRYAIVAHDTDGTPLIAEELDARALKHLSPKARRIAGMLMAANADVRAEVLDMFTDDGQTIFPWSS